MRDTLLLRCHPGASSELTWPTPGLADTEQGTQSRAIVTSIQAAAMRGIRPKRVHMTDDRSLKQSVRRRMEQTGEKYTDARRAVMAQAGKLAQGRKRCVWEPRTTFFQ